MKMGRGYVITSGKGGVGKTSVTAALGGFLARQGFTVAAVDADSGLRNLDVTLGLENKVVYDVQDVLEEVCSVERALIRDPQRPGLSLLSGAGSAHGVTAEGLRKLADMLRARYQVVLIDCPAGIDQGFETAVGAAQEAIVVTTPDVAAVRDACRTAELLRERGFMPKLILNRCSRKLIRRGDMIPPDEVMEITGMPLLGTVREDKNMVAAANRGTRIDPKSGAGRDLFQIADLLAKELEKDE